MARSVNEWVVLGLLAEEPAHGFALARALEPHTDLGRILTVRRPLVYRALGRLVEAAAAVPSDVEAGEAGPDRRPHRITRRGRRDLDEWLAEPVAHVRDLRIDFLVKVRLTERRGLDPAALVGSQRRALAGTLDRLAEPGSEDDVVDRWRRHNAVAVGRFLDELVGPDRGR